MVLVRSNICDRASSPCQETSSWPQTAGRGQVLWLPDKVHSSSEPLKHFLSVVNVKKVEIINNPPCSKFGNIFHQCHYF